MTDPVPETKPTTRWFWVGLLVLLAVALVIFVFNADGDEDEFEVTDEAITTQEERLNTDLGTTEIEEGYEQVEGVTAPATGEMDQAAPLAGEEPMDQPMEPVQGS